VSARAEVWRFGADADPLRAALAAGAVLVIPTESSYGLGVDPTDAAGVATVFRLKGRPAGEALPVVVADAGALAPLGVSAGDPALAWAAPRWPAALSVLVGLRAPIPASAGRRTLAVRVPAHAALRALLAELGSALTATSANPSGQRPFVDPDEVARWVESEGVAAVVVDGGRLPGGPPSTLVEIVDGRPRLLRAGRYEIA
jgi:L-threonylcarbamoyladenylate synthase